MEIAEAVVERFLTANGAAGEGACFICPQFELRDESGTQSNASVDCVVLQFLPGNRSRVILVEISDSGGLGSVGAKAAAFRGADYKSVLARQIATITNGCMSGWPVEFMGFVRTRNLALKAKQMYPDEDMHFYAIEDAFLEGSSERRELGLAGRETASSDHVR